jgi:tetratricopeptide (TPR) repeat protein
VDASWRPFLRWRALGAAIAVAVLSLFLFGSPVDLDPRLYRVSVRGLGALARYMVGDYAGAARAYREELRRTARSWERVEADAGLQALIRGDLDKAEALAKVAIAQAPGAQSARLTLAEVALQRGQPDVALATLRDDGGRFPGQFDTLLLAAVAHTRSEQFAPAIDLLNRALRDYAEERETSFLQALEVTGELTRRPAATRPACLLAHLHRYLRIFDSTQARPAIRYAKQAIARGDRPADAYFTLGMVYNEQGYPDDALSEFARALERDPSHTEALRWSATLYRLRGDLVTEYQMIRRAYEAAPDDPVYATYFGDLLLDRLGDVHQARAVWERAVRERPQDGRALAGLGEVEAFFGNQERAIAMLEAALRLDATNERAQRRLGRMVTPTGPRTDALALLQRGVQLAPDSPAGHASLATALNGLGEYHRAIREYERAFQLGWHSISDYQYLCELYFYQQKNLEKSARCFRWVLTVQPRNTRALRLLPEVEKNLALRAARP